MDTLIELIVWLLKSFFGEPEKPADMSRPAPGSTPRRAARGPYNYGDQGNQPKTLEEILEEVRQQTAQRRQGPPSAPPVPPVPARRVAPAAPRTPAARRAAEPLSRPLSEQITESPRGAPPAVEAPRPAPAPVKAAPEDARHSVSRREALPSKIEAPPKPKADQRPPRQRAEAAASKALPALGQLGILRALRAAPREAKLTAARESIVLSEVLGLPRGRRPWNPARRAF